MSALHHQTFTEFILSGSTVFYPPTHFEVKKEAPPISLPISQTLPQPPPKKKTKKAFYRKNSRPQKPFYSIRLIHPLAQSLFH
jgi:hypothetical protein